MTIPYGRQTIDQADVDAVREVLQGDWLTQGPAVESFERGIAEATGAAYAVAFANGTAALHAAAAITLEPGDELVTSALTFAASANCGAYVGARPRFADIEPSTWNVSPDSVAAAVTQQTKAIVPVHFAGLPAPVREIREQVGPHVRIIEDGAHALGAHDADGPIGACRHSDMTTFSFHPVKAITAGEGGMVTMNDPELRERLMALRDHGFARAPVGTSEGGWLYDQRALGFNYRLSDIHSALGRSQLRRLDAFITRRNEVAARYREALADVEQIELPPAAPEGSLHAYHLFVIRHREGAAARHTLYDALRDRGIGVQVHYTPVYWHTWYRENLGYERGLCPEAEAYYAGALSLPCFPALSDSDQLTVIEALGDALETSPTPSSGGAS